MEKRNVKKWYRHGAWWKRLFLNRKYKDVLFRLLFREKKDLSFIIGSSLNLYEHQSSWNQNMPLRGLLYFARQFEGLLSARGHNRALMGKCRRLWEYAEFSAEIEENIKGGMDRKEAVETAMDACIEKGILRDILLREKAEVLHMLLTEYDEKKHMRTLFREGREEGLIEGRAESREEKLRELVAKKLSKGKTFSEIAEELEEDISVIERIAADCRMRQ